MLTAEALHLYFLAIGLGFLTYWVARLLALAIFGKK